MFDFPTLSAPFVNSSNMISSLFGSSDYSSVSKLLNVQMKMLENISSKMDVIQKELDQIYTNLEGIEQLLEVIPAKTVQEHYKSDLEGVFILAREKIAAYVNEKEKKALTKTTIRSIFDPLLAELQISRARILGVDNVINIPLIATCLHYELFCMVLDEQPKAFIERMLNTYKEWFIKSLKKTAARKKSNVDVQQKFQADMHGKFEYTKFKKVERNERWEIVPVKGSFVGKEIVFYYNHYTIYFEKFNYQPTSILSEEEYNSLKPLLDNGMLKQEEIPLKFFLDPKNPQVITTYTFTSENDSSNKPLKILEDFIIEESQYDLAKAPDISLKTEINSIPVIPAELIKKQEEEIKPNGYSLLMYSSLQNIAHESLQVIARFLNDTSSLDLNSVSEFATKLENISRVSNERATEWIKFIDEKKEQIEAGEKRQKILELRDQMNALKTKSTQIFSEYEALERELAEKMPADLLDAISRILAPIGKEIERGAQNIIREHEKFVGDLGKNLEKAVQDIGKETEKTGHHIGDLFQAAGGLVENEIRAFGKNLSEAEKRVKEGKMIDALWHITTDTIKSKEENAAKAFQDSSLLTSIASAAASIYGAPYGGPAFAAWLTYKQTGSLEAALKTAFITYLTQEANASAKTIEGVEITDIVKRTLVTSATGAAAIAASGGGEKEIIDGFLKGAALSLANEAYNNTTRLDIEGKAPVYGSFYDKDSILQNKSLTLFDKYGNQVLKDGKAVLDITKLSREVSHVGLAGVGIAITENSYPMQLFAQIPFVNDMAYYHDQLCAIYGIDGINIQTTLIPATMLTIAGSDRPIMEQIIEVAVENANK